MGEGVIENHYPYMQGRRWTYTDYQEDGVLELNLRRHDQFRGLVRQRERCPDTGREHTQGYVEFKAPIRLAALKKVCPQTHWELAKGTREHNITYCTKEESRLPGTDPTIDVGLQSGGQGRRNDLLEIASNIVNGTYGRDEILDQHPDILLKYSRGVNELLRAAQQRSSKGARTNLQVEIIWGPAGTGKTRHCWGDGVFILERSNSDTIWWDGYDGEETLLIDDFYGWCKHSLLLRILDIYPCRLDIKGGTTYAKWTKVYITSNVHPAHWYKNFVWEDDDALRRRVHKIWHVKPAFFGYQWRCEKTNETIEKDKSFETMTDVVADFNLESLI